MTTMALLDPELEIETDEPQKPEHRAPRQRVRMTFLCISCHRPIAGILSRLGSLHCHTCREPTLVVR